MQNAQNVHMEVQGTNLVIVVDLSQSLGMSASEKSLLIASTGGGAVLPEQPDVRVNLTVYRPVAKAVRSSRSF
jgi:hypothetical protein